MKKAIVLLTTLATLLLGVSAVHAAIGADAETSASGIARIDVPDKGTIEVDTETTAVVDVDVEADVKAEVATDAEEARTDVTFRDGTDIATVVTITSDGANVHAEMCETVDHGGFDAAVDADGKLVLVSDAETETGTTRYSVPSAGVVTITGSGSDLELRSVSAADDLSIEIAGDSGDRIEIWFVGDTTTVFEAMDVEGSTVASVFHADEATVTPHAGTAVDLEITPVWCGQADVTVDTESDTTTTAAAEAEAATETSTDAGTTTAAEGSTDADRSSTDGSTAAAGSSDEGTSSDASTFDLWAFVKAQLDAMIDATTGAEADGSLDLDGDLDTDTTVDLQDDLRTDTTVDGETDLDSGTPVDLQEDLRTDTTVDAETDLDSDVRGDLDSDDGSLDGTLDGDLDIGIGTG